ncbi:MAG: IS3 family transposase [Patescibacteria group bacterium]
MENKSKVLEYLSIARSSFYYHSLLDQKDIELKQKIELVLYAHPSYGHKRIAMELSMNKKPVLRVMKKYDIRPRRNRKKPRKSRGNKKSEASPNLLVSLVPLFKNHLWITDFTYLKWRGRWVYVCTVIDLFTREVIGLSIKTSRGAILTSEALLNALMGNQPPTIIHSDQGSEYKSKLFRMILKDFNITQSMSKKASPWQNGYQESFYGNWKVDIGDINRFKSLGELTAEIYKSIYYYNHLRIHTSLSMPPKKFADKFTIKYNTNQEKLVV